MTGLVRNEQQCAQPYSDCRCQRPKDRHRIHVCDCGGSWTGKEPDQMPRTFPGGGNFGEALDRLLDPLFGMYGGGLR